MQNNIEKLTVLKSIAALPRQKFVWLLLESLSLCDKCEMGIESIEHQDQVFYALSDLIHVLALSSSETSNVQRIAANLIVKGYLDTVVISKHGEYIESGTGNVHAKKYVRLSADMVVIFNL